MKIVLICPSCDQSIVWNVKHVPFACPFCQHPLLTEEQEQKLLSLNTSVETNPHLSPPPLNQCPLCQLNSLYIEKNFNRSFGLTVIFIAVLFSFLAFSLWGGLTALLILLSVASTDVILYHFLPLRTCCYQCETQFIGIPVHPNHLKFDLHTYELFQYKVKRE